MAWLALGVLGWLWACPFVCSVAEASPHSCCVDQAVDVSGSNIASLPHSCKHDFSAVVSSDHSVSQGKMVAFPIFERVSIFPLFTSIVPSQNKGPPLFSGPSLYLSKQSFLN